MTVLTVVVTALTALLFLGAAWVKFTGEEHAMQTRDRLGFEPAAYRMIGVFEVAGAVGALVGLAVAHIATVSLHLIELIRD